MAMQTKVKLLFLLVVAAFGATPLLEAANKQRGTRPESQDQALRSMRDEVAYARLETSNHEAEIQLLRERLENLEDIFSSFRRELSENNLASHARLTEEMGEVENRLLSQEGRHEAIVGDLKQLRDHLNDLSKNLSKLSQQMGALEKQSRQQNDNVAHMQSAMKSLLDAYGANEEPSQVAMAGKSYATYLIQSGDSLEKIAKKHHTTIQAIKELNQLKSNRIMAGQKIKVPAPNP